MGARYGAEAPWGGHPPGSERRTRTPNKWTRTTCVTDYTISDGHTRRRILRRSAPTSDDSVPPSLAPSEPRHASQPTTRAACWHPNFAPGTAALDRLRYSTRFSRRRYPMIRPTDTSNDSRASSLPDEFADVGDTWPFSPTSVGDGLEPERVERVGHQQHLVDTTAAQDSRRRSQRLPGAGPVVDDQDVSILRNALLLQVRQARVGLRESVAFRSAARLPR